MRILLITTRLRIGGITTYIKLLASGLKERGHEVIVCASAVGAENLVDCQGARFIPVDMETKFEFHPKLINTGRILEDIIEKYNVDLIHAHTRVTQVLAARVGKKLGIPVVSTCHGFYPPRWSRLLFPCWGDHVIAISPQVEAHLIKTLRVAPEKITVVLNGVDVGGIEERVNACDRNNVRAEWGFGPDDIVLVMPSRIEKVKGHDILIEAVRKLSGVLPHLRLLIAGTGSDEMRIRRLADSESVRGRVVFSGVLPDITKALKAADIMVMPQVWEEGFGLSVIEAMACKLPVIASKTGALPLIVLDGKTGFLVKPGGVDAIAQAIQTLANTKALRSSMGDAGGRRVLEEFSAVRFTRDVEVVYFNVLAKYNAPRFKSAILSEAL